jgi:hypothetical protein
LILTYLILCFIVVVQAYFLSTLRDELQNLKSRVGWLERGCVHPTSDNYPYPPDMAASGLLGATGDPLFNPTVTGGQPADAPKEPCLHEKASFGPEGAYCPDCGANGTFPFQQT